LAVSLSAQQFLGWLEGEFLPQLPAFDWHSPDSTAILVIDLIQGFCDHGPLASPRVAALVDPVVGFLQAARSRGVQHICFCCDEHPPDSPEFQAFPPHCLKGTSESELTPRLLQLNIGKRFGKAALSGLLETELLAYLENYPQVKRFVLVGDCTDLCIYQTAMHLRMLANARGHDWEVVVLADLVDTYDLPLEVSRTIGALPHPAALCHAMSLYQLRLNGCAVQRYSSISA